MYLMVRTAFLKWQAVRAIRFCVVRCITQLNPLFTIPCEVMICIATQGKDEISVIADHHGEHKLKSPSSWCGALAM